MTDATAAESGRPDTAAAADTRPDTAADSGHLVATAAVSAAPSPSADLAASTAADTEADPVAGLVDEHLSAGGELADAALTAAVAAALQVTDRTARRRLQPYRDPSPSPPALVAGAGVSDRQRSVGP